MAPCGTQKVEWEKCLSKSGQDPNKCLPAEDALRKCGAAAEMNFCIPETRALMACTSRPTSDGCASAFLAMRECNRPTGPLLAVGGEGELTVGAGKGKLFVPEAAMSPAPSGTTGSMMEAAGEFAKKLGIDGISGIRF